MKQNMGNLDRLIRILIAGGLAALYFSGAIENSTLATVLWVVGIIMFITAVIGYCPIYSIFHINTLKRIGRSKKPGMQ